MMEMLADAFIPTRSLCSFGRMLKDLTPELRSLIERLMANKEISTRKIHLALQHAGAHIGRDVIGDHRDERCVCNTGWSP